MRCAVHVISWFFAFYLYGVAAVMAQPIDIEQNSAAKVLRYSDVVREDLTPLDISEAVRRFSNGDYKPIDDIKGDPRFGTNFVYGPAWVRLKVHNSSDSLMHYRFDTRRSASNVQTAYIFEEDRAELIWSEELIEGTINYNKRYPKERLLASNSFSVPSGEIREIFISYSNGFFADENLWLLSEDNFNQNRLIETSYTVFIFGLRIALIAAIFAFAFTLRFNTAYYYGAFSAFALGYFAHIYGFTGSYLLQDWHLDNTFGTSLVIAAIITFTLMIRSFFNIGKLYPKFDKFLLGNLFVSLVLMLIYLVLGTDQSRYMFGAIAVISLAITNLAAVIHGWLKGHSGAKLLVVATLFLFANVLLATGATLFGIDLSEADSLHLMHFGMTLDTILFFAALILRALAMRQELDAAREARLFALEEKEQLTKRLDFIAEDHSRVLALAEQRRAALAATSHDLKQPLLSLQMALKGRAGLDNVSAGLSYVRSVIDNSLSDTHPDNQSDGVSTMKNKQPLSLQRVFSNIIMMFSDEAEAKGLHLSAVKTSLETNAEAVELMRCLANLVANAIKHTHTGRIVLGARRRGEFISIQVLDSGPGINPEDIDTIFASYVLGADSEGEGLGLSVVRDLAEKNGWLVSVNSVLGKGSCFDISGVPRIRYVQNTSFR